MIVTIDGPAGTGKSTVARHLATALDFDYLDTGAMYRMLAWKALQTNTDLTDHAALARLAAAAEFDFDDGVSLLNGTPLGPELRTADVSRAASFVAQAPQVRDVLVARQRDLARNRNIVCEGRDQGTVVFPQAEFKFFLTATPEVRARRRLHDLAGQGIAAEYDDLLQDQLERDARDLNRAVAPLRPAPDAVLVDTTNLSIQRVIELLEHRIQSGRERLSADG